MKFRSLGFTHFRNLIDSLVPTDTKRIVLVGTNGQGKTNFLEAIYVLCYGSSFRALASKDMIKHGQKNFSLCAIVETEEGYNQHITSNYFEGKREIRIDGREIKDRKELMYNIPCIVFSHDDISFVRGAPEHRRRFFDQTMSMYNPLFFDDLRRYRLILKQRNAAIKEHYTSLLSLYDEQLAQYGLLIQQEREKAVEEFNTIFPVLYKHIAQTEQDLTIVYKPSWNDCSTIDEILDKLHKTRERDEKMQTTTCGIHRDQFVLMEGKQNFLLRGSTGQMRLASLIFRVAQMKTYLKKTKKPPILLIDDVLLELDIHKRGLFLEQLDDYSQAFFTFLPDETYFFSKNNDYVLYTVKEGSFIQS